MTEYLVAATHPWNRDAFQRHVSDLAGDWHLIAERDALTAAVVDDMSPRYVFFPHWSWLVPDEILGASECVCFHMTDLPYGRGGSPLQNLIVRGVEDTVITALRMTGDLDAGPIYLKRPLALHGSAQEIYERASDVIFEMIAEIVAQEPAPLSQEGPVTEFTRRTPEQSQMPDSADPKLIYDHIRMLDAEGYPHAFCDVGPNRLIFSQARLEAGHLTARVAISQRPDEET